MLNKPASTGAYPYLRDKTPGFMHNNISFHPFYTGKFAVASGSNFTLVGNGRVHVMDMSADRPGGLGVERIFETRDCVYDVAWNEENENQVLAACGDGSIRMFDTGVKDTLPVMTWHEHVGEVASIDWNNIDKSLFVSGSWDGAIKIWNTHRNASLITIKPHGTSQINQAVFSPHHASVLSTCSEDGTLTVIDIRQPRSVVLSTLINSVSDSDRSQNPQSPYRPPPIEVLSCDWNKYNSPLLATASKDGKVRMVDTRGPGVTEIGWHALAAKRVAWSPYSPNLVASTGYDMYTKVWDTSYMMGDARPSQAQVNDTRPAESAPGVHGGSASRIANNPLAKAPMFQHTPHTEFIMGLAWSLFEPGYLVDASWDQEVHVMPVHKQERPDQSVGQPVRSRPPL
ncbi:hypothetical protein IAU59_001242 [Kwoniella sp. CBS 9459]